MKPYVLTTASVAALAPVQAHAGQTILFPLTVSTGPTGASTCLPKAQGTVIDHSFGEFENLEVAVHDLPPNTGFDLFSIEVPKAPFGLAWYIRDILITSGFGSIRRMTPQMQGVRVTTPRSTANITPAFRS